MFGQIRRCLASDAPRSRRCSTRFALIVGALCCASVDVLAQCDTAARRSRFQPSLGTPAVVFWYPTGGSMDLSSAQTNAYMLKVGAKFLNQHDNCERVVHSLFELRANFIGYNIHRLNPRRPAQRVSVAQVALGPTIQYRLRPLVLEGSLAYGVLLASDSDNTPAFQTGVDISLNVALLPYRQRRVDRRWSFEPLPWAAGTGAAALALARYALTSRYGEHESERRRRQWGGGMGSVVLAAISYHQLRCALGGCAR